MGLACVLVAFLEPTVRLHVRCRGCTPDGRPRKRRRSCPGRRQARRTGGRRESATAREETDDDNAGATQFPIRELYIASIAAPYNAPRIRITSNQAEPSRSSLLSSPSSPSTPSPPPCNISHFIRPHILAVSPVQSTLNTVPCALGLLRRPSHLRISHSLVHLSPLPNLKALIVAHVARPHQPVALSLMIITTPTNLSLRLAVVSLRSNPLPYPAVTNANLHFLFCLSRIP